MLRPGGRLVIEIMHRDALVLRFRDTGWHLVGEGRLLLEQRTFDPAAGVAQTTQTLVEPSGERDSRTFSLRVYTATELLAMLGRAGFEESRCYGDLSGGALRQRQPPGHSSRAAEARQPVVGDRLPVGRRLQPLMPLRRGCPGSPSTAPRRIPTIGVLESPLHRWPPQCAQNDFGNPSSGRHVAHGVGARDDAQRLRRHHRVQRPRRAAAALAALAMAVPGGLERIRDLEPHRPART